MGRLSGVGISNTSASVLVLRLGLDLVGLCFASFFFFWFFVMFLLIDFSHKKAHKAHKEKPKETWFSCYVPFVLFCGQFFLIRRYCFVVLRLVILPLLLPFRHQRLEPFLLSQIIQIVICFEKNVARKPVVSR